MSALDIEFYTTESGRCPIDVWLDRLKNEEREEILEVMDVLRRRGHMIRMPFSRPLEDGIFELRGRVGKVRLRVPYFYRRDGAVLTHGFKKKTDVTPRSEIVQAKRYRRDWLNNFSGEKEP